ncbi:hypothetical protein B7982_10705 [Fibrobacter sp. UWB2]|uniref:acyltransferase family protein n=1 Tax=Fibrobacter sp. UWB2 TaxID=1964358 RepID=UPI000B528641|nr:hypothetical protein B7982_10705 [Fibrobacter sp. UWB2]
MPNIRIFWLDSVKFICIMFVMLSHLDSRTFIQYLFYDPFFLTCFFFASGFAYKHQNNFKTFVYKKFRGLFIPWFVFSNINILLSHLISFNSHEDITKEFILNLVQLRGHGDGVWFVAALFIAFIPFYYFIQYHQNSRSPHKTGKLLFASFILSLASVLFEKYADPQIFPWNEAVLPWHVEYIFQANFFMILGYLYKAHNFDERFASLFRPAPLLLGWSFYIAIIYIPYYAHCSIASTARILVSYAISLLGCILIIGTSKKIPYNRYVAFIGQNTLIYFALHGKCYSVLQTLADRFFHDYYQTILNNELYSSLFAIALTLLLSLILIIPALIINKYFYFIIGRKKVTSKSQEK